MGPLWERAISDQPSSAPGDTGADVERDVHIIQSGDRRVVLVGTAHVSRESAELARRVVERERPDRVCVELDARRHEALAKKSRWQSLDLKQVIRNKQIPTLLVNLLLASYQRKIGGRLGVMPGTELLEAVRAAEEQDIPVELCDRDIRTTMLRAWRSMSFWQKNKMLSALLLAVFGEAELTEKELAELRSEDVLSEMMAELSRVMPSLKSVLIDERDAYLAERIRTAEGRNVVAVVGAGHVEGIRQALEAGDTTDLAPLETIPRTVPVLKWIGWGVPVVILGSLAAIAWTKGGDVAGRNLVFWILANGIPSCIGAVLALAHPLTVLAAFLCAPITSLTPVIGAGYVTAFVQAYVQPPRVIDFENVADDAGRFRMWWSNRLLKVFLAFILPSLGSILGTYVGGYEILSNLF